MQLRADEERCFRVSGRNIVIDGIRYLNYSGSFLEFTFTGTRVTAVLKSVGFADCEALHTWIGVYLNGSSEAYKRLKLEPDTTREYVLYEEEEPRTVTLRLVKMSEAAFAKLGVVSLTVDCVEGGEPVPTKPLERRIEFIGDSITCGYGNEGVLDVDTFTTAQENPMKAYSIRTARNLNGEYHLVSWSGIGIISSWVPEDVNEPLNDWLMPKIYPYTDAGWCNELGMDTWEVWDSKRFLPDVVVINLGTNDMSYTRGIEERVNAFGSLYYDFLHTVREKNPDALIVCTLGVMGQDLCEEEQKQVNLFAKNTGDDKIFFLPLAVQSHEDGIGADSHPSAITHGKMADTLTAFIKEKTGW